MKTTSRRSPIDRQLEAYQEAWKPEHNEAMRCRDFEEALAVGIAIFRALARLDTAWRQRVSQGTETYDPETEETLRGFFHWWLQPCTTAMERLRYFEGRFDAVEGAADFRRCCEETQEILQEWKTPTPPHDDQERNEPIIPDTDALLTTDQMAAALEQVSQPTEQESAPLDFNPDDYPLF
jgi:hypothetical protein